MLVCVLLFLFSFPSAAVMEKSTCRQQLAIILLLGLWLTCCAAQTTPSNAATPSPTPSATPQPQTAGLKVRLAGYPRKHNEGRVELFYKGEWGTICDDDFSISNANVLCRQLGFVSATGWTHSAKYGKGQGKRCPHLFLGCNTRFYTRCVLLYGLQNHSGIIRYSQIIAKYRYRSLTTDDVILSVYSPLWLKNLNVCLMECLKTKTLSHFSQKLDPMVIVLIFFLWV